MNLVIQSVTVGAVEMFGGGAAAWRTIAFIYCIIGIITNTLAVFSVKELSDEELKDDSVAGEEDDKLSFKQTIKLLFSNKYFSMICVIYILQQLRASMVNVGIFFMTYVLLNKNLFGVFSWANNIPLIIALAVTPALVSKMKGMYKLNKYSYMLATVCRLMVAVAGYLGSVPLMLLFTVLTSLGEGPWQGDIIPYDIGFRRLEMIDKVIYLNGKRLVITGVNRHEWSAKTGRSISMDEMTADIDCMIRNNINAVRTCHYPDQIPWYYLCDKAGIYVMAETNMESHGTFQKLGAIEPSCSVPCSIPQWREAVVDRARSNFETFKNHTAILFWSLGNESYAGDDIEAMNTYFKEKQDGRFVHYESSFYDRNYEETISDVESRMYAKPYEVEEYLNNNPKKPYLLCEYMHDMGNSMGGLGTYMKLIDKYEMYHGGFIWDFIDQALLVKDEVTGKEVLRYGGDFDDKPSDYEFSGNGIVFADRKEKPAMQEVRYYYGLYR